MIALKLNYNILIVAFLAMTLVSCSDPWAERQSDDDNLSMTLNEAISKNAETSKFAELLVKTGYDKILATATTYTVFVPTNEVINELESSVLNNPQALSFFVSNHIALTAFSSVRDKNKVKIKMLSGKYLELTGSDMIGGSTIKSADRYASNGVFHIISKLLSPKINIWEYVKNLSGSSLMSNYLNSLTEFNIYKADSLAKLNPVPGRYSDSLTNSYLRNVYNLNNEKNSYTLFLMEDAGYSAEVDKLKPYLIKNSPARTIAYSSFFTVRDLVFPKAYLPNELPEVLTTRFGVTVKIDKTQIVGDPIVLSNGIVYRIKNVDVPLSNRLVTTKIEGENNYASSVRNKVMYRDLKDPSNSLLFMNDIMVKNSAFTLFQLDYRATDLYSTTYKVYWRAINDVQTTAFLQRLVVGLVKRENTLFFSESIKAFDPVSVNFGEYNEVYIGEFTLDQARDIDRISLVGANSTVNGTNTMSLDYLKFVPVVK